VLRRRKNVRFPFTLRRAVPNGIEIAAVIVAIACGGSEFSSNGDAGTGGSGGGGGSLGKSGSGGASGSAGNPGGAGGAGGGGGASGSGGTGGGSGGTGGGGPCSNVTCGSTEYCNGDTGKCAVCSNLARFRFGQPERIEAVSTLVAGNQRFPRVAQSPVGMLFRMGTDGEELSLWLTPDFNQPGSEQPFGASVDSPGQAESGALEAETHLPSGEDVNLFFDRAESDGFSRRDLLATFHSGPTSSNGIRLPAPFNAEPTEPASSNYSIAVATQVARAWWMTDRNDPAGELVTAPLTAGATATRVDLATPGGCQRSGADATPWVPADASLMLFRYFENCEAAGPNDLFVVLLAPSGAPAGAALPLEDVNRPASDETDPSMSADLCWLYFASDGGQGEFDVYRAPRR
jgi:hypothetical protein